MPTDAASPMHARWALLERASLRYARAGEGPTFVLLHEMGGSLESWDGVVPALARRFDVVRCDLRGAGNSEKIRAPIAIRDLADDVLQLLDHLGCTSPVFLAGSAIGGCVALWLAAHHPYRVRRLIAINPPTHAEGESGRVLRERAALTEASGMRSIVDAALARSYPAEVMGDGRAYRDYRARFLCNDPSSYAFILRALEAVDFDGVLEKIACPTLFVSGRFDKVRPSSQVREVAKRVPGARFREVDGGHILSVQAPDTLASELLAFATAS